MPPCAAVLGGEVGGNHLELLHHVLGKARGDAGASGIFVVELFGGIVAVHVGKSCAGDPAERQQAERPIGGNARRQQHEGIDAPVDRGSSVICRESITWETSVLVFHQRPRGRHIHFRRRLRYEEFHIEIERLADSQLQIVGFITCESAATTTTL